ncbi:MAG: ABC transporter ATP-binding protein [Verrucomicrobiota bacterium]|jgi:putative ABC transport system ATP-binding protein|nr:ABC transporter ATP-binding protein [Verrucomicrobiota bacterium]
MIICEALSKHYRSSQGDPVRSLDQVSLRVERGEFLVIRGHSGSGKTTLLLTLGAMLHPTGGRVLMDGKDVYEWSRRRRAQFRAQSIGFVFQMFHLIPYLSVLENVLASHVSGPRAASRQKAENLLRDLGLGERLHHYPGQLSAGEKQRAALARAMAPDPVLMLADEPTGNLDPDHSRQVCDHLKRFQEGGGTVIFVTHGDMANAYADRTIKLEKGKLLSKGAPSVDAPC